MRLEDHINLLSQVWKKKYKSRMMKIGLSLGLTCPNRKKGGCIFCLPTTFTDKINDSKNLSLAEQISLILPKVIKKTKTNKFVAYLQDETSTACLPSFLYHSLQIIEKSQLFTEIIISTRPDYINKEILEIIKNINLPITIEIGMQTIHDSSLTFLNRNHTHQDTINALSLCDQFKIPVGVHLIVGIPMETNKMILDTIAFINEQDIIKDVKIHNLVIYRGTKLAEIYNQLKLMSFHEYLETLTDVICYLAPNKTVSRLFTSNLRKDCQAIESFSGFKQIWLNQLWIHLKEKNVYQGKCLH